MEETKPNEESGTPTVESNTDPNPRWFLIVVIGILLLQLIYGVAVYRVIGPDMSTRGQFGDMFGGLNALFTGLAFAAVIYTILLQRKDLELQRLELQASRQELHTAAEAQVGQVAALNEAANLRAMTALVNTYGTQLWPVWEKDAELRIHLKRRQTDQSRTQQRVSETAPETELRQELTREMEEIEREINYTEKQLSALHEEFGTTINEQERLVSRFEEMVEQATPTKPTDTSNGTPRATTTARGPHRPSE